MENNMEKQNEKKRRRIFEIAAMIIATSLSFCIVACIYKLPLGDENWIRPSIYVTIPTIFGAIYAIWMEYYWRKTEQRAMGKNIKLSKKQRMSLDKIFENLLKLLIFLSIILEVIVIFITGVLFEVDDYMEYALMTFVGIWFGFFVTVYFMDLSD